MLAATAGTVMAGEQPVAASNSSDPAITVFPVTRPDIGFSKPLINAVDSAPDGTLWFIWEVAAATPSASIYGLGTVTNSGQLATFRAPSGWTMSGLVVQAGFEWVTESHDGSRYIGKWTPAGTLGAEFAVPAGALRGITWGHDYALWFAAGTAEDSCGLQGGFIGRMTPSGVVTTTIPLPGTGDNGADYLTAHVDGSIWFDLPKEASVGRISPSGVLNEFALPGAQAQCDFVSDQDLVEDGDPDGAVWVGSMWSGGVRRVASDGTVTATYPVNNLFSVTGGAGVWLTTAFSGSVEWMDIAGHVVASWPLDSSYPAGAPLITGGRSGTFWIGVQGAIELLNMVPSIPTPTPSTNGGTTGVGGSGATPSPSPSSSPAPTPQSGFLVFTPSPSPGAGAGALASARPSSGSALGIVLGSVAAVVVLASGAGAIVIRRRQRTPGKAPPTP